MEDNKFLGITKTKNGRRILILEIPDSDNYAKLLEIDFGGFIAAQETKSKEEENKLLRAQMQDWLQRVNMLLEQNKELERLNASLKADNSNLRGRL